MTTPPPPAISDEKLAEIEDTIPHRLVPGAQHLAWIGKDDLRAIIARLRAAEAFLAYDGHKWECAEMRRGSECDCGFANAKRAWIKSKGGDK